MPSHFYLIWVLNHLNLHLIHLIKCIKVISQLRSISISQVFLMSNSDIDNIVTLYCLRCSSGHPVDCTMCYTGQQNNT